MWDTGEEQLDMTFPGVGPWILICCITIFKFSKVNDKTPKHQSDYQCYA